MFHYHLTTARYEDCRQNQYPLGLIQFLTPIVKRARLGLPIIVQLPHSPYSLKLSAEDGCAVFDISQNGFVLSFNTVVWAEFQHDRCWNLLESTYLKLVREFNAVQQVSAPHKPGSLPWLATLVKWTPKTRPGIKLQKADLKWGKINE